MAQVARGTKLAMTRTTVSAAIRQRMIDKPLRTGTSHAPLRQLSTRVSRHRSRLIEE
jgi:hypothetical protein